MKFAQILNERFVNVFTPEDKASYMEELWSLLEITYAEIGGLMGASKSDLISAPGIWKLVRKNGKIVSGILYRDMSGRKIRLVLHNNTEEGKDWVKKIVKDDIALGRSWGEVSGALEAVMIKLGAQPVSNLKVEEILGKPVSSLHQDGYHYTRDIGGDPEKQKIILGNLEGW